MIRAYGENDLQSVMRVWGAAAAIAYHFLPEAQLKQEQEDIQSKYLPVAETWVYEQDGQVVGFISLFGSFIGGLFVEPAFQCQGIGGKLIQYAGMLHKNLFLDVFRENFKARRFYENQGFRIIREGIDDQTGFPDLTMQLQNSLRDQQR